jgi:host factor-I protein
MPAPSPGRRTKPGVSSDTGQEALYLRFLSDKQINVEVKLRDGELVRGWIEYFDDVMIRLTREGRPNLFIYKGQIRTISEPGRREEGKRRAAARNAHPLPESHA